jgi:hypothetical protein
MPEGRKDFDLEVLGPALAERAEKGQDYIAAPLAMQGKLFGFIAKEIIERFGEEGKEAVIEAVKEFGKERGRRMAEFVESEGREPSFASFLVCSDLDTSYHEMVPHIEEGAVRVEITYCPFAEACKEWGVEEYGKLFCRNIDGAIMQGYNPERYETICEQNLTEGAEACIIVYKFKD